MFNNLKKHNLVLLKNQLDHAEWGSEDSTSSDGIHEVIGDDVGIMEYKKE